MKSIEIVELGRGPTLVNTRITVCDLIPYLRAGRSPEYIAAVLHLTAEQVAALLEYIEEHQEAVLAWDAEIERRIARGNPPEIEAKRQASHVRLLALREELRRKKPEANGEGHRC